MDFKNFYFISVRAFKRHQLQSIFHEYLTIFFLFSNSAVQTFKQWNLIATLKFFWSNLVEHPLEFSHQVCFFFFFFKFIQVYFFFSENVSVGYMITPIMLYSESIVSNSTTILNEFLDEQKLTDSDYYNMSLLM